MNSFYNMLKRPAHNKLSFDVSEVAQRTITGLIPHDKKLTALEYGISDNSISYLVKDKLTDIVMIDGSSDAVRAAQEKITREGILNIWPMCIDLERDYFMGEFDLIYSVLNLHRASKPDQIIRKISFFLRPGGHLVILDVFQDDEISGDNRSEAQFFTIDQMKQILERNKFTNISHTRCFTLNPNVTTEEPREILVFIMVGKA
jgi:Methylase involved in ubiquinone/menaquinone biosynthesis